MSVYPPFPNGPNIPPSALFDNAEIFDKLKVSGTYCQVGNMIVDGTITATAFTDSVATLSGGTLSNLLPPTQDGDAANKKYVDDSSSGGVTAGDGLQKVANVISVDSTVMRNNAPQQIFDTTDSISSATGCLVLDGGLGIAKNVNCSGVITATNFQSTSDCRLKKDIEPIHSALSIMNNIKPVKYKFRNFIEKEGRDHYGVTAQNLQEIGLRDSVSSQQNGNLSVNYLDLVGILLASVKELNTKIEGLEQIINNIEFIDD